MSTSCPVTDEEDDDEEEEEEEEEEGALRLPLSAWSEVSSPMRASLTKQNSVKQPVPNYFLVLLHSLSPASPFLSGGGTQNIGC